MSLPVIFSREDPLDAFVSNDYASLDELPAGGRLGTSSLRRKSQILAARSDLQIMDLRGNVNTRLAKLDAGEFNAIILAKAGLIRLDMADRVRSSIPATTCLPAVGQGAVGIEIREDDVELAELLAPLNDDQTRCCVLAERAMSRKLQGNCQVPVAGYAVLEAEELVLTGVVADLEGVRNLRVTLAGSAEKPEVLGAQVAAELLAKGADEILTTILRS